MNAVGDQRNCNAAETTTAAAAAAAARAHREYLQGAHTARVAHDEIPDVRGLQFLRVRWRRRWWQQQDRGIHNILP